MLEAKLNMQFIAGRDVMKVLRLNVFYIITFILMSMFSIGCGGGGGSSPKVDSGTDPSGGGSGVGNTTRYTVTLNQPDSKYGTIITIPSIPKDGKIKKGTWMAFIFAPAKDFASEHWVSGWHGAKVDSSHPNIASLEVSEDVAVNLIIKKKYTVTLNQPNSAYGTITSSPKIPNDGKVKEGTDLTFTFTPKGNFNAEQWVSGWQGAKEDTNNFKKASLKVAGDVTVELAFSAVAEGNFSDPTEIGEAVTITVLGEQFDMIYSNDENIVFPFSPNEWTPVNNKTASLNREFFMGKTEVSNSLMVKVLQWAYDCGKFSNTPGDHNYLDGTTVKYGGQELLDLDASDIKIHYASKKFTIDSGYEKHPVVFVSWYGAIMFCNWITEMRDGNTSNCVYSEPDTDWEHGETVATASKSGYRLPSNEEWEYAGRYIGTVAPTEGALVTGYIAKNKNGGSSSLTEGYFWTPADYASGAINDCGNTAETRLVAWFKDDAEMGAGGNKLMAIAKKRANNLGLYDMNGNAREWCFDADGSERVRRGGSWKEPSYYVKVGYWGSYSPSRADGDLGFRFARSK